MILAQKAQNGYKTGHYDASKKSITWDVYTNYHQFELKDATFEDRIDDKQKLNSESVQIFEYEVLGDGSVRIGKEVTESMTERLKVSDQTIFFQFPEGHKRYLIRFETSLITAKEETVLIERTYHNEAKLSYGEKED